MATTSATLTMLLLTKSLKPLSWELQSWLFVEKYGCLTATQASTKFVQPVKRFIKVYMTNPEESKDAGIKVEEDEINEGLEKLWETQFEYCDICGHQSYYIVTLVTGKLFFCAHHYKLNKDALLEIAEDILDESNMLLAR